MASPPSPRCAPRSHQTHPPSPAPALKPPWPPSSSPTNPSPNSTTSPPPDPRSRRPTSSRLRSTLISPRPGRSVRWERRGRRPSLSLHLPLPLLDQGRPRHLSHLRAPHLLPLPPLLRSPQIQEGVGADRAPPTDTHSHHLPVPRKARKGGKSSSQPFPDPSSCVPRARRPRNRRGRCRPNRLPRRRRTGGSRRRLCGC